MKFYKVIIPVGYDIFKIFEAESAEEALKIGCKDLEHSANSWIDEGCELWNRYSLGTAVEADEDDLDLFEYDNENE